ncbi:MAG: CPBP family intramembrane metalloprotease [Bacteroidota bacterium]|nr:CPBP family intramembrane metalloprotease [Bacteroidota bacterium]
MNHLESSFSGRNNPWRYIVMFAAVLVASNTVGAVPLLIAYAARAATNPEVISEIAANPGNLGVLGLDPNLGLFVNLFPFLAGLAIFILLIKPLNGRSFFVIINGTGKIRWNRFLISGLVWLILSAIYFFIYLKLEPSNFLLENTSSTLLILIAVSVIFIPFQAAFEETLFRGYLMQGFAVVARNRWFPILVTSLLFGLMHAFNPEVKEFGFFIMMPQYVLFGLIFGVITILDDGIEAAIGAHTANNIFLCIMVTHTSSALQTPAVYEQQTVYPWTEFAALLATGIIFVLILKVVFKWEGLSTLMSRVEEPAQHNHLPNTEVLSSLR